MKNREGKMPELRYEKALLIYIWQEYKNLIEKLAHDIKDSEYPVNQIFCIATGGIPLGLALGIKFGVPIAISAAQSYQPKQSSDITEIAASDLIFCREIAIMQLEKTIGSHALLIDDLTETRRTLTIGTRFIQCRFPGQVQKVRTATIWHKGSTTPPDWFAERISTNTTTQTMPYIVQPHEQFSTQDLQQKLTITPPQPTNQIIRFWPEYTADIIRLAQLIHELEQKKGVRINQVVALTSGGLLPGMIVARILKINFAILAAKNLSQHNIPNHIPFARDLVKTTIGLGNQVIIIDDRTWEPTTLQHSIRWLQKEYGWAFETLYTAVLYHGPNGYPVNIATHEIDPLPTGQMPKIIQPMESEFQPFPKEKT